jgi:hypothetical protein
MKEEAQLLLRFSLVHALNSNNLILPLALFSCLIFVCLLFQGVRGWAQNDRGVSYVFGSDVVRSFLQHHNCSLIVRAHQVVEDGYQFFADRSMLTLFSAPNYCGEFDNAGAVLAISEDLTCWFSVLSVCIITSSSRFFALNYYLFDQCLLYGDFSFDRLLSGSGSQSVHYITLSSSLSPATESCYCNSF